MVHLLPDHGWAMHGTLEAAQKAGAEARFNLKGEQLIKEGDKVVGVYASDEDGNIIRVNAKKGVVLSCGDMSSDTEMLTYYAPQATKYGCFFSSMDKSGKPVNTGDGHKMALWAGAAMQDAPFPPMLHPQRYSDPFSNQLQGPFLYVDEQGKRFFNEGTWVQARSLQIIENTADDLAYSIFDSSWPEDLLDSLPHGGGMFWDMFRSKVDSTYQTTVDYYAESIDKYMDSVYFKADTLDDLAKKIGVPADAFKAQIERYNGFASAGMDEEFGMLARINCTRSVPNFSSTSLTAASVSSRFSA